MSRLKQAVRPSWGSGRNFDFCYCSETALNLHAEIKRVMSAQTRRESEYGDLLRYHNPFQLLVLCLGVTKIKISPGTPIRLRQAPPFCWPIEELLKLALAIIELERAIGSPVTSSKR
jgi:hypothetical protein